MLTGEKLGMLVIFLNNYLLTVYMEQAEVGVMVDGCQLLLITSPKMEELLGKTSIHIQLYGVVVKLQVSPVNQSG